MSVKGQLLRLGVAHEQILSDWRGLREGPLAERVKRLNPKGQVPVLEFEGSDSHFALPDSFLICAALEARHGAGLGWMESTDALLFRTADVEVRDAMMALYGLPPAPTAPSHPAEGSLARAALGKLSEAASLVSILLPPDAGEAPTAGALHAAFLLRAAASLASRAGLEPDATAARLVETFSRWELVRAVSAAFSTLGKSGAIG